VDTPTGNHERPGSPEHRDQSVGELVKQLAAETTTLVKQELELARAEASRAGETVARLARQELELAKAEMAEKGRQAGPGIRMISAGVAVALLAAGALTAFLVLVLDEVMPDWLAALLVGLGLAAGAAALYYMGRDRVRRAGPLIPKQTVETVKEDVEWAKTQIASEQR
jgi:Putative Actinobacterial Holin-X, holin superfamily III